MTSFAVSMLFKAESTIMYPYTTLAYAFPESICKTEFSAYISVNTSSKPEPPIT